MSPAIYSSPEIPLLEGPHVDATANDEQNTEEKDVAHEQQVRVKCMNYKHSIYD